MTITVKIVPPDGNWQTACELIQSITASCPDSEINFIVEDVFSASKKGDKPIILCGNHNANAVSIGTVHIHDKNSGHVDVDKI